MAYVPNYYRRFAIILVELFVILKIYDVTREKIGLPFDLYLVILFIMLWVFNIFLSKIDLGKSVQDSMIYKILPRMLFSSDWFGIGTGAAILGGFFLSKSLGSAFLVYLVIAFFGIFAYLLIIQRKNILRHSWGLVILGFVFGVAIGNKFTNNIFIVGIFVLGGVLLYITTSPGEI